MSVSAQRLVFGVYSLTLYNRTTGESYGMAKVIGEVALNFTGELVELYGGAQKTPWAIEEGKQNSDVVLKLKEYPAFLWQIFQGKMPTVVNNDAGNVVGPTNVNGTSVVASTGLASVSIIPSTGAANLKQGRYVIKAADATHVNVYAMSDVNFARGASQLLLDDQGLVTASPLAITTGGNTDITSLGLRLVGGASATAFQAGDTAIIDVYPPSTRYMEVAVGGSTDVYPEFGAIAHAKPNGSQELTQIDIYRMKAIGLPLQFQENKFSESEIKAKAFFDSAKNGVYKATSLQYK
jgi:hypothetical protein